MKLIGSLIILAVVLWGCFKPTEPEEDGYLYKLCIMNADGTNVKILIKWKVGIFDEGITYPMFTMDDTHIIFNDGLYWTPVDHPAIIPLSPYRANEHYLSLSPDGVHAVHSSSSPSGLRLINLSTMATDDLPTPGFNNPAFPVFTDNGDSIVYRGYSATDNLSQYRIMAANGSSARRILINPSPGNGGELHHFTLNQEKTFLYFIHGRDNSRSVYQYNTVSAELLALLTNTSVGSQSRLSLSSDECFLFSKNSMVWPGFQWINLQTSQAFACHNAGFACLWGDNTHILAEMDTTILKMNLSTGATEYLGKGSSPGLSHDGTKIVFVVSKFIEGEKS